MVEMSMEMATERVKARRNALFLLVGLMFLDPYSDWWPFTSLTWKKKAIGLLHQIPPRGLLVLVTDALNSAGLGCAFLLGGW